GEGVQGLDAPFGGGGQVGADDGEVGQAEQGAPGAAGGVLGGLDRSDVALGLVGGEPDSQIGDEPQDHVLVAAESHGQGQRVPAGPGPVIPVRRDAVRDGVAVPGPDALLVISGQPGFPGGPGGASGGVGLHQDPGHVAG